MHTTLRSTNCPLPIDFPAILCHTNSMNKTNTMTDLQPTDFELAEMQAEHDAELDMIRADLEAEEWADFILSTIG